MVLVKPQPDATGQRDDLISLLEEASALANIHGQVLSPGLLIHRREDATVQVSLENCLMITGEQTCQVW